MNHQGDPRGSGTTRRLWIAVRWFLIFLYYALGMVLIGALTGCAVFLLLGPLFLKESTLPEMALGGLKVGTILAGIWAPGVAIVKCFIRGKRERDAR